MPLIVRYAFSVILVGGFALQPAFAGEQAPACRKAEVNPVTGHVLCVDPLGAEVEPAPAADPCKETAEAKGDWTFHPSCKDQASPGAQG